MAAFDAVGARTIRCDEPGLGTAFNIGLAEARHEIVLLTNDDCTVEPLGSFGWECVDSDPDAIVSGRVRPQGDPDVVPSTIDDPIRRDHVGGPGFVLYTQCMALRGSDVLGFGGFDGRIRPSAEDNDLSYRWLRAGRRIRYEPDFVVWHQDWRTREQLERMYVGYGVGQGMVYAKHLRRGDLVVARFLARDLYAIGRGFARRVVRGPPPVVDWRFGFARASGRARSGTPCVRALVGTRDRLDRARCDPGARRHPRWSQFDYLHIRRLVDDISTALARIAGPVRDVLDIYCGTRPYDDLLPEGVRCVGLDVPGNPYDGIADVISDAFLPFEDESFDLVTCYEAFQYVPDPAHGIAEMRRVLRPGGTALVTVPFAWEYDRAIVEHRYTEPELAHSSQAGKTSTSSRTEGASWSGRH